MDENTPLYGGDKGIKISEHRSIKRGDTANTKKLELNNHSGTHVDYPNHFFINGLTSENYSPDYWVFKRPFLIIKNTIQDSIINLTNEDIESIPKRTDLLIYKTGFGKFRDKESYWKNNPGFAPEVAEILRDNFPNLRAVGMDFISLTAFQNRELGRLAHRKFLGGDKPILLIEDMNLDLLESQPKSLVCAPLLIKGLDGAPINIIAEI